MRATGNNFQKSETAEVLAATASLTISVPVPSDRNALAGPMTVSAFENIGFRIDYRDQADGFWA